MVTQCSRSIPFSKAIFNLSLELLSDFPKWGSKASKNIRLKAREIMVKLLWFLKFWGSVGPKWSCLWKIPFSTEPDNLKKYLGAMVWYTTGYYCCIVIILLLHHGLLYRTVLQYNIHQAGVVEVRQMPRRWSRYFVLVFSQIINIE